MLINKRKKLINSFSIDKADLLKLCNILQERANRAVKIELEDFKILPDQTPDDFEEQKRLLQEAYILQITVTGSNGEELFDTIDSVFSSPNFPEEISGFYVNSAIIPKVRYEWNSQNAFELNLQFSKPNLFDFSILPSQNTPNASFFETRGFDSTWVNGVFAEVVKFIDERNSSFSYIHKNGIYDILLMLLGLPFAFWICFRTSVFMDKYLLTANTFLKNSLYVYIFFLGISLFHMFFRYLRWLSPLVEFRSGKNSIVVQRIVIGGILLSLISAFIYDLIKFIF